MTERANLWTLRLLAIVAAIAVWMNASVAKREAMSERVLDVTVTYNPKRQVLLLNPTPTVKVRLRGSDRKIRNLNPLTIEVLVDISRSEAGLVEAHLGADNVVRPDDLDVVSVEPNLLRLQLDREASQLVAVRPRLVGEPAAGAQPLEARVTPDAVLVSGPESTLRRLTAVETSPIHLDGHALSFSETATVQSPDSLVRIVQPTRVKVEVPMQAPGEGDDRMRHRGSSL